MNYRRNSLSIILSLILVILSLSSAEAKWWIFGQSEGEVSISYLFINKASFDETGSKITLYKEALPDGKVTITGRAVSGKGKIGSARISLDGKETWNDANLAENGAFEYSFRPELGKTYSIFIEVSDTTGKTNDVAATARQVTLSDRNIMSFIKEALDKMIEAYKNHDPRTFMSLVSEDFAGDKTNLDRAVRKDFSLYDNIDLRYTLNNITSDTRGISVSLSYSRMLTRTSTGQSAKDNGVTEFVFKMGEKGAKVYSMKNPLIFGVSDPSNVATGTVSGGSVNPLETVEKGSRTLVAAGHPPMGFTFVDGQVAAAAGDFQITGGGPGRAYGFLAAGVTRADLGTVSIGSVTEAPATGYSGDPAMGVYLVEGHTYAFKLANGKYGLMEVKTVTEDWTGGGMTITMRFEYKYQPSGARQFLP